MYYYKTHFQYSGKPFKGFQWQQGLATVQNEINLALSKMTSGKITTLSASRTDSGVHALCQIVKISAENSIETSSFSKTINGILSSQIQCLGISECLSSFNPMRHALTKEYRYFFSNDKMPSIENDFIVNVAYPLNLESMQICVKLLEGKHNFQNFCSSGSNVKSKIRDIKTCELELVNPQVVFSNSKLFEINSSITHCYQLRIVADGFLKQMIRHIVRGLWMVGSGKLSIEDFKQLLEGPLISRQLWKVANPKGLFLYEISY